MPGVWHSMMPCFFVSIQKGSWMQGLGLSPMEFCFAEVIFKKWVAGSMLTGHSPRSHLVPCRASLSCLGKREWYVTIMGFSNWEARSSMDLSALSRRLGRTCELLRFSSPVSHVYNPVEYAWTPHQAYLHRYGEGRRRIIFLGMNPGPFGMAQTGVPFGDPVLVRDFLGLDGPVNRPVREHPKRPILGFESPRREISGKRFWSWVASHYETSEKFFQDRFVWNYCPLMFLEESGRNLTPNRIAKAQRDPLLALCDEALAAIVRLFKAEVIVSVGRFAEQRAVQVFQNGEIAILRIPHPSGANPQASRNWGGQVDAILSAAGLE